LSYICADIACFSKRDSIDVGNLRQFVKISSAAIANNQDIIAVFMGCMTDNLVLEQFCALGFNPVSYWYYDRGKAEVDFLIQYGNKVISAEVKSGLSVSAKSLKFYRDTYQPRFVPR